MNTLNSVAGRSNLCSLTNHNMLIGPCKLSFLHKCSMVPARVNERNTVPHAGFRKRSSVISAVAEFSTSVTSASSKSKQPLDVPRKISIAVDNTQDAEEAVQWAVKNILKKGDEVHLVHVLLNTRAPTTGVGAMSSGEVQNVSGESIGMRQAHLARIEEKAKKMIKTRFAKHLKDFPHAVDLPQQPGHKSAAGVGEVICRHAAQIDAAVLLIASHGSGVLADYGSVAKYCSQNAPVPVIMIPPHVGKLTNAKPGKLMVVALDDMDGLQRTLEYTLKHVFQPKDAIHVLFMSNVATSDDDTSEIEATAALNSLADRILGAELPKEDYSVDLVAPSAPLDTVDYDLGTDVCERSEHEKMRMVVLLHHGKGMVKEMLYGSITNFCTRNSTRPLLVIK